MINLENIEKISALLGKTVINKENKKYKVGAVISYQRESEEIFYIIKSMNEEIIMNGKEKEILKQLLSWERIKE